MKHSALNATLVREAMACMSVWLLDRALLGDSPAQVCLS